MTKIAKTKSAATAARVARAAQAPVSALAAAAELAAIDIARIDAYRIESPSAVMGHAWPLPARLRVVTNGEVERHVDADNHRLFYFAALTCDATDPNTAELFARVSVRLRLVYQLREEHPPISEDLADDFAHQVVMQHAWPFFRERFRTLTAELGLTPLVLPLRRPNFQSTTKR